MDATNAAGQSSQGSCIRACTFCASLSSTPQLVMGVLIPSPRKLSAVSPRIIEGMVSVAITSTWLMVLGKRCRVMIQPAEALA